MRCCGEGTPERVNGARDRRGLGQVSAELARVVIPTGLSELISHFVWRHKGAILIEILLRQVDIGALDGLCSKSILEICCYITGFKFRAGGGLKVAGFARPSKRAACNRLGSFEATDVGLAAADCASSSS
jgi:hypothetical protein